MILVGCREEQYFDREEVLGRDLTSVFPTEAKKAAVDGSALAELLGAGNRKFISETEVGAGASAGHAGWSLYGLGGASQSPAR